MEHHTPNPPYDGSFEDQRYVNVNNRSYWVEMSISWHVGGLFGPDYVSAPTFEVTGYNYLTVANFRYVFRGSYGSFVAFCDLQFGNISIFVSFDYDEDTGVGYLIYSV